MLRCHIVLGDKIFGIADFALKNLVSDLIEMRTTGGIIVIIRPSAPKSFFVKL